MLEQKLCDIIMRTRARVSALFIHKVHTRNISETYATLLRTNLTKAEFMLNV